MGSNSSCPERRSAYWYWVGLLRSDIPLWALWAPWGVSGHAHVSEKHHHTSQGSNSVVFCQWYAWRSCIQIFWWSFNLSNIFRDFNKTGELQPCCAWQCLQKKGVLSYIWSEGMRSYLAAKRNRMRHGTYSSKAWEIS